MSNLEPVLPRRETWSLRRLHANFEQKQEKNHVNESLEKTLKHIMLTERTHHSMLITESNNGMHLLNKLRWTTWYS